MTPDRLFLLAVFSHTGPIRGDLGDAPGILLILGGPDVALVNGLRPRIAHMIVALLGEGRRRKGDNGEPQNKCSETFVDSDHNELPSLIAKPSPLMCERRRQRPDSVFTAGERTRSRNRATAAASESLCVGGRFCHSKFCAALIALSITRSDFMEKKCVKLWCAGSCE